MLSSRYQLTILIPDYEAFKAVSSPTDVVFRADVSLASQWLEVCPLPECRPELIGWPAFLVQRSLDEVSGRYQLIRAASSKQILELERNELFFGACPWRGELIAYFWQAKDYSAECPPEVDLPVVVPLVEYRGLWR